MKFEAQFVISPPWPFGLPDGDAVVVPAAEGGTVIHGPSIDIRSGRSAGHGSLPRYRSDEEAVNTSVVLNEITLRLRDNLAFAECEMDEAPQAQAAICAQFNVLLRHLSLALGVRFTAVLQSLTDASGEQLYPPLRQKALDARFYSIQQLSDEIERAAKRSLLIDERLSRALRYHDAAGQIRQSLQPLGQILDPDSPLIVAEFLNLWKSITTIVGDPANKQDRFQSRYRSYGLDQEVKARIDRLKELRDRYDVAHYSLDHDALRPVKRALSEARSLAKEIIDAYCRHLEDSKPA